MCLSRSVTWIASGILRSIRAVPNSKSLVLSRFINRLLAQHQPAIRRRSSVSCSATVFLCVWSLHAELTKNNWSHSQRSFNLERNIVKRLTLTGKQTKRNIRKKLSRNYHRITSIFSLFHFFSSMKILASISV